MVSRTPTKRKAIAALFIFVIAAFVAFVINVIVVSISPRDSQEIGQSEEMDIEDDVENVVDEPVEEEVDDRPMAISLQSVVDEWVGSTGGQKGIIIYDLDLNEIVGEYQATESFRTASLYKLFVVYEGYLRLMRGELNGDDEIGWYGDDITTCLDLAIRESNSSCAEPIWNLIGRYELDDIILNDYQIEGADISSLYATPKAIMEIMKKFYELWNDEVALQKYSSMIERMKDSFLNQPIVNGYDWRQGLPRGISDNINVYNKVGWQWSQEEDGSNGHWEIYDDAAIISFPDYWTDSLGEKHDRNFIVVVMTNNVRYQAIREFGTMIENTVTKEKLTATL